MGNGLSLSAEQCSGEDLHDLADLLRVTRSPFDSDVVLLKRINEQVHNLELSILHMAHVARLLDPSDAAKKLNNRSEHWSSICTSLNERTKARQAGRGCERLIPRVDVSNIPFQTMEGLAMDVGCCDGFDRVDDRTKFDIISDLEWYISRGAAATTKRWGGAFPSQQPFLCDAARALNVSAEMAGRSHRTKRMVVEDLKQAMSAKASDGTSMRELATRPTLRVLHVAEFHGVDLQFLAWLLSVRAAPTDIEPQYTAQDTAQDEEKNAGLLEKVTPDVRSFRRLMADICSVPQDVRSVVERGDTKLILPYLTGNNLLVLLGECSVKFPFVHPRVVSRRHLVEYSIRLPWIGDAPPGIDLVEEQLGVVPNPKVMYEGYHSQWWRILSAVAKNPKSFKPADWIEKRVRESIM